MSIFHDENILLLITDKC